MKEKQAMVLHKLKEFQLTRVAALQSFPSLNKEEFKSFERITLFKLLKAQKVKLTELVVFIPVISELSWEEQRELEIETVYEDYVHKQLKETALMNEYEKKKIPVTTNYYLIHNMAAEAKEKLTRIKPFSIGQAARIAGINPTDIQALHLFLKSSSFTGERKP